jgi:RNA polymerase sporulation-specific sigma factor
MDDVLRLVEAAKNGDRLARSRIVAENSGLVWSVVKRFLGRGYEADDLFQIGSIGLLKCIDKFDLSYNVKFSTYAVPMIIGEIKRFLRDYGMIKVSRGLKEVAVKARYTEERILKETGKAPSLNELADAIGCEPTELVMALESGSEVESLYQTLGSSDSSPFYLIDKINQDNGQEPRLVDELALKEVIARLKPKERQIIILRYFRDQTQAEVAKRVGVSQVQVSRIEKKLLGKMREELES